VVQGGILSVTWTLQDASNKLGFPVNNSAANTLVLNGPLPNSCATIGDTTILANGNLTPQSGASTFPPPSAGQYTLKLDTDVLCAGNYTVKLKLDSTQTATAPSQLQIDVTDTDTNPHVPTSSILNGVVGTFYSSTISEHGGVTGQNPFTWTLANGSNPLPPGLSLGTAPDGVSGLLSGIPSAAGMFSFTVQVTDSVGNIGTQTLTMTVTTPVAQINQPLVPDSSVPGGAAFVLTLNGTGFGPGSVVRWNGSPRVTTFNSNKQLTAAISASDRVTLGTASVSVSNPITISNKAVPSSNIDFFQITNPTTSVSLSRTDFTSGVNPLRLIAADFNGDGKSDLAIPNGGSNTVSILLGNGDGTFQSHVDFSTGPLPYAIAAGDFNGDGKLDLAVANFNNGMPSTVSILLGNGNGTFQPHVDYTVGNGPISVVTGDFNGDGKLDLAVANQNDHSVSILLGNGDGTFQPRVDYAAAAGTGTLDAADVVLGDFNRDGKLDLAVPNPSSNTVSILLGNGDGTFQAPVGYTTGNHPVSVTAADLNGDGKLDLAITNLNDNTVSILLGNGSGTFQTKMDYSTTTSPFTGPAEVITGDFNGDGNLDLAITNQNANTVSILLGNGSGTFQAPLEFTTGTFPFGVATGDFNADGRLDVAVGNHGSGTVSVMLQPQVLLVPSVLAFGNVSVTTPTSNTSAVSLTNNGPAALTISNIAFAGTNPGDFSQNNNCPVSPATLAAGGSCTINVTFTPTQTGARSTTLIITDSASVSPQMVNITGTGTP